MAIFPYLLGFGAWLVLWRVMTSLSNQQEMKRLRQEDWVKWLGAVEENPRNAGARANLAEMYLEDGHVEQAIHEYRIAINLMPRGPHATAWKRKLKFALEYQERCAKALAEGRKLPGFEDWRVCDGCDSTLDAKEKRCPHCGTVLHLSFLDFVLDLENQRVIAQAAIISSLVFWICAVLFMGLPIHYKGAVIIVSVILWGYSFLRSFDGLLG